ncbi:MAG: pyocin knob domain-containing protein, partial [Lactobacillus sp.]|nr:pyocin knob domain-containing protein [Lactobacillus sp.]
MGNTSDIDNVWRKYQITFSTTQTTYEQNPRVHCPTTQGIPGGSLFFANFKLEAGSIATDWCQSYLDFDRLDGRHDPVDAPDFNSLTNTGTYLITQPDHGQNYPVAIWGILKVDNAHDSRIEQTYYADQQDAVYYRQCVDGTWKLWRRYANQNYVDDNLNKIKFRNQALDKDGNKFDNFQSIAKQSDGSYRLSTFDSDWTAYHVNWLLNHTKAYDINDNADLNNYKQPGFYNASGTKNIKNAPVGSWFALIVNANQWNGEQTLYDTNSHLTYIRTWSANGFTAWHQIAYQDDLNVKVVKGFNIETNKPNDPVTMNVNAPWLVDQTTLATFANAHRDVRNHTDYRYPTDQAWNTAINLNSDPYLDTGIYKIGNCATINGPWPDTSRRWYYLTVIKYDDNTIYQTVDQGPERFVRTVSKTRNSYPQWDQFATMNRVVQNVSSVSGNLQAFITDQTKFQKRVDYENPTGTITNDTVNFNNYRETGILKVVNCLIQNGPYKSDYRHTVFLKITNLDGQTQYQTVYEGDNLYGRKLYNGNGQWHKYTNT